MECRKETELILTRLKENNIWAGLRRKTIYSLKVSKNLEGSGALSLNLWDQDMILKFMNALKHGPNESEKIHRINSLP